MAKHANQLRRARNLSTAQAVAVAIAVAETTKSAPLQTSTVSDKRVTDVKKEPEDEPAKSEWVVDIKKKLEEARADEDDGARSWPKLSIYRIPQCLHSSDKNAYVPQTVSLGPYHHGQPRLSGMERHKWRALHQVLKRTGHRIESYLDAVEEIEDDARAHYEGPIDLSSDKFVEMLLLDSSFTLELFRGADQGFEILQYSRSDPIFGMRVAMTSIQRDMIMLENQIPLFVLDRIHDIQDGDGDVASLALRFFEPLVPTDEALPSARAASEQSGLHCLDVFRRSLLEVREEAKAIPVGARGAGVDQETEHEQHEGKSQRGMAQVSSKRRQPMIHCVTELKEAGVKFKAKKTGRLCDIDFDSGVLKIPRLLVDDGTKSLFLNLIAFEQCHLDRSNGITSYAIFMDRLIDSPEDVAYLHRCGIVESCLGSDVEVSDLFNGLCHEVEFDINDSTISELSKNVNRYYKYRWNAWRANLRHNYFNNPWSILSFIAATVLVLLTLAQTFYAVYAYYMPPS